MIRHSQITQSNKFAISFISKRKLGMEVIFDMQINVKVSTSWYYPFWRKWPDMFKIPNNTQNTHSEFKLMVRTLQFMKQPTKGVQNCKAVLALRRDRCEWSCEIRKVKLRIDCMVLCHVHVQSESTLYSCLNMQSWVQFSPAALTKLWRSENRILSFSYMIKKVRTKILVSWKRKELLRRNKKHFSSIERAFIEANKIHFFGRESPTLKDFLYLLPHFH